VLLVEDVPSFGLNVSFSNLQDSRRIRQEIGAIFPRMTDVDINTSSISCISALILSFDIFF
jgi:hypothetical protein